MNQMQHAINAKQENTHEKTFRPRLARCEGRIPSQKESGKPCTDKSFYYWTKFLDYGMRLANKAANGVLCDKAHRLNKGVLWL